MVDQMKTVTNLFKQFTKCYHCCQQIQVTNHFPATFSNNIIDPRKITEKKEAKNEPKNIIKALS